MSITQLMLNIIEYGEKMKYFDFKEDASFLQSLDPFEYTIMSVVIALLISNNLSTNEKNSIGNFIIEVCQTMLTIASQENLITNLRHSHEHNNLIQRLEDLERQINVLKKSRFNSK